METHGDLAPGASSVTDECCFPSSVTDECCFQSSVTDEYCFPPVAEGAHRRVSVITGFGCKTLAEMVIEIAAQADARPVVRDIGAGGGTGECLLG